MADFINDDNITDDLQEGEGKIEDAVNTAGDIKDFIDRHSGQQNTSGDTANGNQSGGDSDSSGQDTENSDSNSSDSPDNKNDSVKTDDAKPENNTGGNQESQTPNNNSVPNKEPANSPKTSDASKQSSGSSTSSSAGQNAAKQGGEGAKEAASEAAKETGKEAGKEVAKEAGKKAAEEGAKQVSQQAVQQAAATTVSSTTGAVAAGTAAGTVVPGVGNAVGALAGLAWSFKDKIFEVVVTVSFIFVVLLLAVIAALPTAVINLTFGLNGGKKDPGPDQVIEENYNEIADLIQKYIDDGYDETIDWIKDNIKDNVPGVSLSKSTIKEILASGDPVYNVNDTTQVVIKDLSLASRQSINPAFVMAVYSASLNNTPHALKDTEDDDSVSEEEGITKFTGTHKKDLKKKLKKKAIQRLMFPASRYGCQITTDEVEVVTYLPTTYEVWVPVQVQIYDVDDNIISRTMYTIGDPMYAQTNTTIKVPDCNLNNPVVVKKVSNTPNGYVWDAFWEFESYKTVEPTEHKEMKTVTQYTYTIPPFDDNCIYDAFGVNPYSLYEDGETYMYEAVETLQNNILETIGKTNADYNVVNVSKKITCTLTSEHGVLWYLFDNVKELEHVETPETDPDSVWYEDGLLRRRMLTTEEFKTYFDLSEWEYASQIQNISIPEMGRMVIRYQKMDPDNPTAAPEIAVAYIYSSKLFTIKTSSFVSPFFQFGADAEIRCYFGYRSPIDGRTQSYHGGMDLGMHGASTFFKPITATATGEVVLSEWTDYGNTVILKHTLGDGSHIYSLYGHLACEQNMTDENYNHASSTPYVSVGQIVQQGEVIGHAGKTYGPNGYATGPHLHFEIRTGGMWGTKVDPMNYVDFSMNYPLA